MLTRENWLQVRDFIERLLALRLPPNSLDRGSVWNAAYVRVSDVINELKKLAHGMKDAVNHPSCDYFTLSALAYDLRAVVQNIGELLNEKSAHRLLLEVHAPSLPEVLKPIHFGIECFISHPLEDVVSTAHAEYSASQKKPRAPPSNHHKFLLKSAWPGMKERPPGSAPDEPMPFL